ncbi:DUF5723 family protein [Pedobacter arcticus]|uniref:DUF5723 family protein n=1 Tax=Pedobacter arcticus TaxID=752140 RepID=UPI0002FC2D10|nr:DUF5723 family protein [Pedobacter arcticus]
MKKITGLIIVFLSPLLLFSQNISLNHSGTQYDSFENPVQQSFEKDFSRKYAVTLLPHLNGFLSFKGDEEKSFKKFLFTRVVSESSFTDLGNAKINQLNLNSNIYLVNYRIFKTRNYNRELGFSLQLREEGLANITNEIISFIDDYRKFSKTTYQNPFNGNGYNQTYWQLGLTYRENYDKRWAFGGKLSLLNGLTYNKANVYASQLTVNQNGSYNASVTGNYISSFGFNSLSLTKLLPNLKNIGVAASLATSYQTPSGFYFTVNLKDMGFIHWGKSTSKYSFNTNTTILNPSGNNAISQVLDPIIADSKAHEINKPFNSKIDTKIEFAASKQFGFYKPVFIFSKSTFNPQGQIAVVNNFQKNSFVFSLSPIYDLQSKLNLGSQIMVKSSNMEFYTGSEQVFPTYYLAKSYLTKNENIGKSNPRASFYIGINVKFGPKMQNIGTAEEIPGLNDKETGYVVRLSKKERKKLQKKNKQIDKNWNKNNKRNRRR